MSLYRYHLIPVFTDNYIFVLENTDLKSCAVVDPGSAKEVIQFLADHSLKLETVLITHHHWDHIDGLAELLASQKSAVPSIKCFAPAKNKKEISQATSYVSEGDFVEAIGLRFEVMELPGHTIGHIGYFAPETSWLFSGDVLFGLGCGRLFEGTAEQQFDSLGKIKKLSPAAKVFCTHEYTERNLSFCKQILLPNGLPPNPADLKIYEDHLLQLRSQGKPSVPLALAEELKCNPFLLAKDVREFTDIRLMRNNF